MLQKQSLAKLSPYYIIADIFLSILPALYRRYSQHVGLYTMDLYQYLPEFLTIAAVHLVAVASPGPDFAVVLKNSISYGRRTAIWTSLGIAAGILIHVAYSLLGIGLIIQTTPWLFTLLTYAAACYLLYIGISALRSAAPKKVEEQKPVAVESVLSNRKAFGVGFLTNGLNPKATLFFLSVFAVTVSPTTPIQIKCLYGIYLAIATGVWFCGLSYFLGSPKIRAFIGEKGYWFDRLMGILLIALAVKLVFSS